jgi:hypothetical protein
MTDNLFLGPDAQARFSLQRLHAFEGDGEISGATTTLLDGAYFSNDPEAEVKGSYASRPGNMFAIKMWHKEKSQPRWQAFHIEMGPVALEDAAAIGIVARSQALSSITTRVCLRSQRDGEFLDYAFPKTMVSFAAPSTHLDMIELARADDIPRGTLSRDLILFFRAGEVELELLDLRLFIV